MTPARVLIVDPNAERRAEARGRLRALELEIIEAASMDELNRAIGAAASEGAPQSAPNEACAGTDQNRALRDRSPDLYQEILCRYEQGIELMLRHRIYRVREDIFEPFRQIAKQLFLANASARDAVELHYQTLRKIAPTPEAPRAQAYLEVGRTAIIGLMGDLLMLYREACKERSKKN